MHTYQIKKTPEHQKLLKNSNMYFFKITNYFAVRSKHRTEKP